MAIPRKKILEKIAGYRKGILYHLDVHIPELIDQADIGLLNYWQKELAELIGRMKHWAERLSKADDMLAEAAEYERRLETTLDTRRRQLGDTE